MSNADAVIDAPPDTDTSTNGSATKSKRARKRKRTTSKRSGKQDGARRPGPKPYPVIPFEQALRFGQGIADFGAGHPMKRATLLEKLGLAVNQATKELITTSGKYGITV